MDRIATNIRNRLSLRKPQEESLGILSEIMDIISFDKNQDLKVELEKIHSKYPTVKDFERSFISLCFALATGVGKTRLMGAFIAYLNLAYDIKHFFVLAPNLTIYNKLIEDFSNHNHPKYVFKGIGEFVSNPPMIITGDNYNQFQNIDKQMYISDPIKINIFNISKINAETRSGNIPRIKRLSEYIGDSYFDYLVKLDDLVILMDESHHYRADRGMQVINELNPILGLELTATPQVEKNGTAVPFSNVIYEYSLAKAIKDGFVKEPAVATRKNFDPKRYKNDAEIDIIKLEDGIRIHEETKVNLEIYARDNKFEIIKPFVLVVAKDTNHAKELKELISSNTFFEGYYIDKVMEIHSNQRGDEKEENIQKLLTLEDSKNNIEIVIHVNMLKEGWDVTNLYTIIPLRTAASTTLREQTIGRGLRLPYGKRTGNNRVDKLTIVAHDRFQEIIDEANKPDSLIRKENIIELSEDELNQSKEVVQAKSNLTHYFEEKQNEINQIENKPDKNQAQVKLDIEKTILEILPKMNENVKSIQELSNEEVKNEVVEKVKHKLYDFPQTDFFAKDIVKEIQASYENVLGQFKENIIEIPRITICPGEKVISGFKDFDLDTYSLNFQPISKEILIRKLSEGEDEFIIGGGRISNDTPQNQIVNALMDFPEIDYDIQSKFLFKLVNQAMDKFKSYLKPEDIENVVSAYKREIAKFIYAQMMEHFYCNPSSYKKINVLPFVRIEDHNLSKYKKDVIHDFKETIEPTNSIPTKIFTGFLKACHRYYKFASKTEKDFSIILEKDASVLKWLKPAHNQMQIYYGRDQQLYIPDFVVETKEAIFIIETKKKSDMESIEVIEKAKAAKEYCVQASEYNNKNSGKKWKYILISHEDVLHSRDFKFFVSNF